MQTPPWGLRVRESFPSLPEKKTLRKGCQDFPGGPVVKNPPSYVGDTGSVPGN